MGGVTLAEPRVDFPPHIPAEVSHTGHPRVTVLCSGVPQQVDRQVASIVRHAHAVGIRTYGSCQGGTDRLAHVTLGSAQDASYIAHVIRSQHFPYVLFEKGDGLWTVTFSPKILPLDF